MWGGQKDIQDLVRGIRANKRNESNYIRDCLQEIKEELKEENHQKKSIAVQKLTYVRTSFTFVQLETNLINREIS